MIERFYISPEIEAATKKAWEGDPLAKEIEEINRTIETKASEIAELEGKLNRFKTERAALPIKWRHSTLWCLAVDEKNRRYFLKTTPGVYKCVAFKNQIDVTPDMKNKVAVTLANLFKDGKIGRIYHNGTYYYGLRKFFTEDLTQLKDEYLSDLDKLVI